MSSAPELASAPAHAPEDAAPATGASPAKISDVARECWDLFSRLLGCPGTEEATTKRLITEYQQRYASWLGYLGVFAQNNLSLDHRLRNTAEVRSLLVQQLHLAKRNLNTAIVLASRKSLDDEGNAPLKEDDNDLLSSPALRATFSGIESTLNRLHKLGASIRHASAGQLMNRMKPFAKGERLGAFERLTYTVLESLYPAASTALIEHICRAMAEKYQKVLYLEARGEQYRQPIRSRRGLHSSPWVFKQRIPVRIRGAPRLGSTNSWETGPSDDPSSSAQPRSLNIPSLKSSAFSEREFTRNYRPSVLSVDAPQRPTRSIVTSRTVYSPAQTLPDDAKYADCQWCFKNYPAETFTTPGLWREHQKQDWEPYICLSEDCAQAASCSNKSIPSFASSLEWQKHMEGHSLEWSRHTYKQQTWVCSQHVDPITNKRRTSRFDSKSKLLEHLDQDHEEYTARQKQRFARHNTVHLSRAADTCPLCCFTIEADLREVSNTAASGIATSEMHLQHLQPIIEEEHGVTKTSDSEAYIASLRMSKHVADHMYMLTFLIIRLLSLDTIDPLDEDTAVESVNPSDTESSIGNVSDYQDKLGSEIDLDDQERIDGSAISAGNDQRVLHGHEPEDSAAVDGLTLPSAAVPNDREDYNPLFLVPFSRNRDLLGRIGDLDLVMHLITGVNPRIKAPVVLHGLAGIGKSEIALEVAYQVQDQLPDWSVYWLAGDKSETIGHALHENAHGGEIPTTESGNAFYRSVWHWFKSELLRDAAKPWLLIVDGVEEMSALTELMPVLKSPGPGFVLVTTRNSRLLHEAEMGALLVPIGPIEKSEAYDLFDRSLAEPILEKDRKAAHALLKSMGLHTLAIWQLASFMNRTQTGLSDWNLSDGDLSDEKKLRSLLNQRMQDRLGNYTTVFSRLWESFDVLAWQSPLAARYLDYLSCLSHEHIPASIFPGQETHSAKMEALKVLSAYHFITIHEDASESSVWFDSDRLVRLAIRDRLAAAKRLDLQANLSIRALAAEIKPVYTIPEQECKHLIAHTLVSLENVSPYLKSEGSEKLLIVYCWSGQAFARIGKLNEAVHFFQRGLEGGTMLFGGDAGDLRSMAVELALIYGRQGRKAESESLWDELIGLKSHADIHQRGLELKVMASEFRQLGRGNDADTILVQCARGAEKGLR